MRFRELDQHISYRDQLGRDDGPIELINVFTMTPEDVDRFLDVWSDDAAYMKRQPGFIRTQLHRGVGGSCAFINVATWESAAALRAAFTAPEFQQNTARYPDSVVACPHVVAPVAVPGICVA